jgi:hypothetical protein
MADEKALADFGSSAVWVPVELLNDQNLKYTEVLDGIRSKFAIEIAEAHYIRPETPIYIDPNAPDLNLPCVCVIREPASVGVPQVVGELIVATK